MANHQPVEIDPKEVQRSQDMWAGFTRLTKYSIIVTIGALAVLGIAFVDW